MATRASDAERERCARALRDHAASGRLEIEELEDRLARVYGARYRHELRAALRDLPRETGRRVARAVDRIDRFLLRAHIASFAFCAVVLALLWEVAGEGDFWPAFLLVPWLAFLAWHVAGSWGVRRMLRARAASRSIGGGGASRRRLSA